MARVAFIGIGTMGLPMARHLLAAGYELVCCDVDQERAASLATPVAPTPAAAVAGADVAIMSLPSPAAVAEVLMGDEGIGAGARPGTLVIDTSTSSPRLAREAADRLTELEVVDAPVSGGPRGAHEAALTIMVGGTSAGFARAEPFLRHLGSLVAHVGSHGAGQAVKLCNNLIAGVTMAALAESCRIAEGEGLDRHALYRILTSSTGDSRVLRTRFPLGGVDEAHPSSNAFAPLFALDLIAKDLVLALEVASAHGVEAPVAAAALDAYRAAQEAGRGSLDYSAVYPAAE